MPLIEVKIFDRRVNDESVPKMIDALTTAMVDSSGVPAEAVQVIIHGVPVQHWGVAGKPST